MPPRKRSEPDAKDPAPAAASLVVKAQVDLTLNGETKVKSKSFVAGGREWHVVACTANDSSIGPRTLRLELQRPGVPWTKENYQSFTFAVPDITAPSVGVLNGQQCLTCAVELQVPAPSQEGDMVLLSSDGQAFQASSHVLRLASSVLRDLLDEQAEQLQQAATSGQPLVVPLEDTSSSAVHMLLQVAYSRQLDSLLGDFGIAALHTLGTLVDKLALCKEIAVAVDDTLAYSVCRVEDDQVAELLLFAHRAHFAKTKQRLVEHIRAHGSAVSLEAFGDTPLLAVIAELHTALAKKTSKVTELEAALKAAKKPVKK